MSKMSKETDQTLEGIARDVYDGYDTMDDENKLVAKLLVGDSVKSFIKHFKPSYVISTQIARREFSFLSLKEILEFLKVDIDRGY